MEINASDQFSLFDGVKCYKQMLDEGKESVESYTTTLSENLRNNILQ